MNSKILSVIGIIVLFAGIFAVVITVANAKGLNLFCSPKQNIIITLKNETDMNKAKDVISKISQIKIIKTQYRDEEWSRMVNKMDLPKMENPFKNEFTIKMKKNANADEIFNKIKEMSFVEKVDYVSDTNCQGKQK